MGVYDSARATALRLIEKFGRDIELRQSSRTPASSSQPWRGSSAPHTGDSSTTVLAKAAFVPLSAAAELGFTEESPDSLTKRGSEVCLVAASGLTPADTDVSRYDAIEDGDAVWRIVRSKTLAPGDQTVLYAFEVEQ